MNWFQIGKGVHQGCIVSPYLFNLYVEYIMQNAGWMKHKLEARLPEEISITADTQMTYSGSDKQIQEIISKRVTEEPWMDVHDIVHCTLTPHLPQK